MVDWLKKAPNSIIIVVIIVCGVLVLATLGGYVALLALGVDTAPYRQLIQTVGQILVYPFLGTTAVASIQAARSASKAEDQTNGQLTARDAQIADLQRQVAGLKSGYNQGGPV
jgi:flagellar basal body-associated protein FliL